MHLIKVVSISAESQYPKEEINSCCEILMLNFFCLSHNLHDRINKMDVEHKSG